MSKTWIQTLVIMEDLTSADTFEYTPPGLFAGCSLLRSIISVYAYGIFVVPLELTDLAPAPIAYTLQEANTEVTPAFSVSTPFDFTDIHVLGGQILTTTVQSGVTRLNTTGTTDEDLLTGVTTYSLVHADLPWSMVTGNSFEDSQAQRFFDRGAPTFQFIASCGPLATKFGSPTYQLAATVKQLFNVP